MNKTSEIVRKFPRPVFRMALTGHACFYLAFFLVNSNKRRPDVGDIGTWDLRER